MTFLKVTDILDLRAYERVRDTYRAQVVAHKRLRRVPLGDIMTVVFESFDTVRFQVQEMARAERLATDEAIQGELDVYNKLLPQRGELSATLFIELTSEEQLRRWLPALVGVERAIEVRLDGPPRSVVHSVPEASHAEALTRESVTPAVHYLRLAFAADQVTALAGGPAELVVNHPAYQAATPLSDATRAQLVADLEGSGEPIALG